MLMLTDDAGQLQSLRKKEAKKMLALERRNQILEKLQIENERLKKGYIVKGVGADKEFVTTKDLNFK